MRFQKEKFLYLEPAEDGGHSSVQCIPPPVAFMDHCFELAGSVCAVFPGQPAVLIVDQLELGQSLMNLPLETLKKREEAFFLLYIFLRKQKTGSVIY